MTPCTRSASPRESAEQKKESIFKPIEFPRCQLSNQADNKICSRCGIPLDEANKAEIIRKNLDRKEADKIRNSLLEDQKFRESSCGK